MIITILMLIILLPALIGWGFLAEQVFRFKIFHGISGKIFCGTFSVSVFLTIIAFFSGITVYAEGIILGIGILFFFREKFYLNLYSFLKNSGFGFLSTAMVCIICASFYPFILDHFGYYVPTIKWISEFGLIRGISNLDLTLGQMSVWHLFQAGFSHLADPFLRINVLIAIAYLVYIFENKSWIHLAFFPALFFFLQSPSPDLPVYIFSLIIVHEVFIKTKIDSGLLAFSIFIFSIKPTMIWLPVFVVLNMILRKEISFKVLIPGLIVLSIFVFKNFWVFGYPVFPLTLFDLNLPWKPNPELMNESSQYAVLKTYDAQYSLEQIKSFTTKEKVVNWLFISGIKSFFNTGLILFLFFYIIFTFAVKQKTHYILLGSLFLKTVLILSFSAQYRFFLEIFPVIFIAVFYTYNLKKIYVTIFSAGSFAAVSFFINPEILKYLIPSFRPGGTMGKFEISQLYQPKEYFPTEFNSFKVGNLKFHVSKKYPFNYETPTPAISEGFMFDYQRLGIFPQLKNPDRIKSGFVWKKLDSKRKTELDNAIKVIKNNYQQP
ncbi:MULTISPECIES: LIC_10190 family membrane protein [unclassified Chryseobacterium]|uniref:LIC_10190 family membrane protein n=1 Tax=unclassified Chryseobacterium TaxID=2593645 RepID=UPI00103AC95A|nr:MULTISPECIES: hypothetical protein [unclassified Chryseobacterium]